MKTFAERFVCQQELNHIYRAHKLGVCRVCGSPLEEGSFICDSCLLLTANDIRLKLVVNYKRLCGCEHCHSYAFPVRSLKLLRCGQTVHESQLPTDYKAFWRALEDTTCLCPLCAWKAENPGAEDMCVPQPPKEPK